MDTRVTDLSDLKEVAGENSEFLKEIIEIFLEQTPEVIRELQEGLDNKNYELLRKTAHKMNTSLGTLGIRSLIPVVRELETDAYNQTGIENMPFKIDLIINTCQQACDELQLELKNFNS